jgi:hypothetical protein
MTSFVLNATSQSQPTPVLRKGPIRITATVSVYWKVGENPMANTNCALLKAGQSIDLVLPVKCSKVAVLAVNDWGTALVTETGGGASSSCSA